MTTSSVISVRMKRAILESLQEYSEILNIRPSTLVSLVVDDCLEEWVKKYSEQTLKRLWLKTS